MKKSLRRRARRRPNRGTRRVALAAVAVTGLSLAILTGVWVAGGAGELPLPALSPVAALILLTGPLLCVVVVARLARAIRADLDARIGDLDGRSRGLVVPPDRDAMLLVRSPASPGATEGWEALVGAPAGSNGTPVGTVHPRGAPAAPHWPPAPPAADECCRANVDVVVVMDVSSSMTAADPTGQRFWAARRLVDLLVTGPRAGSQDDRVGVVLFADRPVPHLPLTPVSGDDGRRRVVEALRPVQGSGTAIAPALDQAAALFTRRSQALPVVVLFTDGRSAEPAEEIAAAVRAIPQGCVHVVTTADLPAGWAGVPVASVLKLEAAPSAAAALEWLVVRIVLSEFSRAWAHPGTAPLA